MGIEPTRPAWKAGILAIELHPRFLSLTDFDYYNSILSTCQVLFLNFPKKLSYLLFEVYTGIIKISYKSARNVFLFKRIYIYWYEPFKNHYGKWDLSDA